MFRRKVRFIPQMTNNDCGPSCLAMLFDYYGLYEKPANIRENKKINKLNGWSFLDLKTVCEDYGFNATVFKIPVVEDLQQLKQPVIGFWELNHFVIIKKVTKSKAYIIDPKTGPLVLSIKDFDSKFSGFILSLEKSPNILEIKKEKNKPISFFVNNFLSYKIIALLVVISLFSQIALFSFPFALQYVLKEATNNGEIKLNSILLVVSSLFFYIFIQIVTSVIRGRIQKSTDNESTSKMFSHLFKIPIQKIQSRNTGDLTVRIMGLERARNFIIKDFINIITSVVVFIPIMVYLTIKNPLYSSILAIIVVISLLFNIVFSRHIYNLSLIENFHLADHRGLLNEILKEHYFVKASGIFGKLNKKWKGAYQNYLNLVYKRSLNQSIFESLNASLSTISLITFLIIGFIDYSNNKESLSTIFFFVAMSSVIFSPINNIISGILNWNSLYPILLRIIDIFEEKEEQNGEMQLATIDGNIEYKDVTLELENKTILKDVNMKIEKNQSIAIIGESGSGKTSLINLLLNIYKPESGNIYIDQKDIEQVSIDDFRKKIGIMTQDGVLFSGSLVENLQYFDTPYNPLEIQKYISKLNLNNYMQFSNINDIKFVEGGRNLSGGQRQRMAMLKLFLRNYPIILMDEPTNHLDFETGNIIIDNIFSIESTKIIITHDERILNRVDRVFEITNHQLIERTELGQKTARTMV